MYTLLEDINQEHIHMYLYIITYNILNVGILQLRHLLKDRYILYIIFCISKTIFGKCTTTGKSFRVTRKKIKLKILKSSLLRAHM